MNSPSKRQPFRKALHRQIARVCFEEFHGAYAIARELGLKSNQVKSPLKTLVGANVLEVEPAEGKSQAHYRLNPDFREALHEAAAEARDPGLLQPGQGVLVVEADDPNLVPRALWPNDLAGILAWSARIVGPTATYVMAFEPDAGTLALDAVSERLASAGATVRQMMLGDVIGAQEFEAIGKLMRQRQRSSRESLAER